MSDHSGPTFPTPADDVDRKLLADVQGHGWRVIMVEADEEGPSFAYSIGLYHTFGHPEVIVFGLDIGVMHGMINIIGDLVREGRSVRDSEELEGVLVDYKVTFRAVDRSHYREYFGGARWFYRREEFPALQCVWPDVLHRYPWHPSFHPDLAARQPVLSDARDS